jgi:hypothetical protein
VSVETVGPIHDEGRHESVRSTGPLDVARRYFLVMKPRIIELLLITTVPAMVIATGGWPGTWLVIATLIGGTLTAGSANAINNYYDRDIDRLMSRTSKRPTARDEVSPQGALIFGIVIGVVGFAWLWVFVNLLAAPGHRGDPLLRLRLHDRDEAPVAPGGRDRRGGRVHAGPDRGGPPFPGRASRTRARGCCSRSCSGGPRRTSGRSR